MSTASKKLLTTFVLVIFIVLALMALNALTTYPENLPQQIHPADVLAPIQRCNFLLFKVIAHLGV